MTVTTVTRPYPDVAGVTHRHVEIGAVRLHIAEAGPPDAPPVLLLHGFPFHWYSWRHVIAELSGEYRLICVDLRGFGWSDAPAGGYDTKTRADDVIALLDALDIGVVRLIAHQWGAWAGFFACLRAPERFESFLALNMVHPWPDRARVRREAWRFWYTAFWEYPQIGRRVLRHWPAFTRFLIRRGTAAGGAWADGEIDEFVASSREPARARAGEALHWQYVLHDIPAFATRRHAAERLKVPTLILAGEEDPVLPPTMLAGGENHAERLRVRVVPGCGGHLPNERPGLVAEAAREVFAGR